MEAADGHGSRSEDDSVAVALGYAPGSDAAPKVVAKGRGDVARRIVELAKESGVEIRRDADLVRVLEALDLDDEIPVEAFAAVAEILSYVYQANGTMGRVAESAGAEDGKA